MRGGEDDYYEAEPNMKLSHAFMVVLILHIVAVGGIYAFNQIKVNKNTNLLENISGKISQATGGAVSSVAAASKTVAADAKATPFAPPAPELRRMPGDADEPLPMVGSTSPAAAVAAPVVKTQPAAPVAPAVTQTAPAKAAATKPVVATTKAAPVVASSATYKVAKGDNPYKIAKKLGVTSQELLKANNIDDPTKLQIGQVLKVPGQAN
jgi:LysM repeat protein